MIWGLCHQLKSMVVKTIQYEGLRRGQSHSWDHASVRSLEKNVGPIPSNLHRSDSCQIQHGNFKKGFVPFRVGISLSGN